MKRPRKFIVYLLILCVFPLFFQGCAALQELGGALMNLKRLQFKLAGVGQFSMAGINITRISSLTDFSVADGFKLLNAFQSRSLPAEVTLEILAINPNDGSGGSPNTVSTLTSLESRLLIDGESTVTGNIDQPIEIPGTGQASSIPLRMSIDLFEFFGNQGYKDLIELALAIGGLNRNSSRLSLDAQPKVSTPYGNILYPGRIVIVDKEFR
jgi:hypothetical protein